MTGFAICGALYNVDELEENSRAFKSLALVLMISRLTLIIQYAVVLFFVRKFEKVYAPLLLTMAALFVASMVFLGTFFGFKDSKPGEASTEHPPHTYAAWYAVAAIEALAVITVSCIWPIVSFRHTHLVERIGLLTLIIMGEGILGITKNVSTILQTSAAPSARDIGVVASSVLLIYFIWVLYFDQIEHDRFGVVRQQIWALLHFPLHVAILLTVEGTSQLILWNIIAPLDEEIWAAYPQDNNGNPSPSSAWESAATLAAYVQGVLDDFKEHFKEDNKVLQLYDASVNVTSISQLTGKVTFHFILRTESSRKLTHWLL